MRKIIIKNAYIFTGHETIEGGIIEIEDGLIKNLFPSTEGGNTKNIEDEIETIDAGGNLVTGGFSIAHTHIYSALARGIITKTSPPENFLEILEKLWWKLDRALNAEDIRVSTLLYASECLKHGVTTIFDHHASFGHIKGSLDIIESEIDKLGMRACLCFEVSDRWGKAEAQKAIEENLRFIEKSTNDRIRAMFGLHASFTLTDETLKKCSHAGNTLKSGFHIHIAEDKNDVEITKNKYGKKIIERLRDFEMLGEKTICAHGIWLDDDEIEILAQKGCYLAYNPQSNLNNAVGTLDVGKMVSKSVNVVIGTDGFTSNLFRETLAGLIVQNNLHRNPHAGWDSVPDCLLQNNSRLVKKCFNTESGKIIKGQKADVVIWNYIPPTPVTEKNFIGHAIFGLIDCRATDVIIDGQIVMKNGKISGINEQELYLECRKRAESLWKKM